MTKVLGVILLFTAATVVQVPALALARKPVAQLPKVYIDTTYQIPIGGKTWAVHAAAQLAASLVSSQPGDVIVLDAGATYTGNFTFPAKTGTGWIYVISSKLANLPAGVRVSPASTSQMPKLSSPNLIATIALAPGATATVSQVWRLPRLRQWDATRTVPLRSTATPMS